jgi:hypothetical protein
VNYLAENAVPIWAGGAVLLTFALVLYLQTRGRAALVAMLIVVLATGGLLVVERLIETPREAVERTLDELAAAIEANDLPGVLAFIAPTATEVRSDAETLMPLVTVEKARVLGSPEVEIDATTQPATATVKCQAMVNVVVKQNGMKGPYMDRETIHFIQSDGRWLIESYTPARDWRQKLRR